MRLALYKGTRPGLAGLFNRLVRWWCQGPHSHGELIFSDGLSASSSMIDGGVRFKKIEYSSDKWDFFDLSSYDEESAKRWFIEHEGQKFDVLGILRFGFGPIKQDREKHFCLEAIMAALGFKDAWRFDPCIAASIFPSINLEAQN